MAFFSFSFSPGEESIRRKEPSIPMSSEETMSVSSPARNALFELHIYIYIYIYKRSFCQDRLGTTIGKDEGKGGVFRTKAAGEILDRE
jgi:hypothetical protein